MAGGVTWTAEEIETLRALYGTQLTAHLSGQFPGRTQVSIALKAKNLRLKGNPKLTRKRYAVDYDYFGVPNLQNSYWAGFIAADGNIDDAKDRVRIKLSAADAPHLELFSAACGCGSPVRDAPNGERNYKALEINGTGRWRKDLFHNYCITPRKTLTLQPPAHLPREFSLAFITGYIDGDGCIFTEQTPCGIWRLGVQITGTHEMLLWVKSWFDTLAPVPRRANVCPMGKVCSYKIAGRKAETILGFLADLPTPKLARKWAKVAQFFSDRKQEIHSV